MVRPSKPRRPWISQPSFDEWPPLPPLEFNVSKKKAGFDLDFETADNSRAEDETRIVRLDWLSVCRSHLVDDARRGLLITRLGHRLDTGASHRTLASMLYMRDQRIRWIGAILLILFLVGIGLATTFTIIPKTWEFTPAQLNNVDPTDLTAAFRTALYEKGAASIDGWMIAFVHGEFDPVAKIYRLHLHGLCSLSMVKAIDALRGEPNYKAERKLPNGDWSPVYRRVWVRRKPIDNAAAAVSYLIQAFWPSRPVYVSTDGERRRVRDKRRIAEPYHCQVLLWLDRWSVRDLALMIGVRRCAAGLKLTSRSS